MENKTRPALTRNLGIIAVCLLGIEILIQFSLASGLLPISLAWGGRHSQLSPALGRASLAEILVLAGFGYVIARRSGLLGPSPASLLIRIMSWMVTIYLGFHVLMKFLSSSSLERYVLGPLAIILLTVCLLISIFRVSPVGDA